MAATLFVMNAASDRVLRDDEELGFGNPGRHLLA